MNKHEYLADPDVDGFVGWMADFVSSKRELHQQWFSPKGKRYRFSCTSLREACAKYEWPMTYKAKSFCETAELFAGWKRVMANRGLWDSSVETSRHLFLEAALQVAEWGEMYQLKPQLSKMHSHDLQRLFDNARLLDPGSTDADPAELKAGGIRYMGAGYSKIYAMMPDEFPIYDSRVACAIASLIRTYCGSEGLPSLPDSLRLSVLPNRGKSLRDPSDDMYIFRKLGGRTAQDRAAHYASSNLKTAWLLQALVAVAGRNDDWPEGGELLALQSVLFMIGYEALGANAITDER